MTMKEMKGNLRQEMTLKEERNEKRKRSEKKKQQKKGWNPWKSRTEQKLRPKGKKKKTILKMNSTENVVMNNSMTVCMCLWISLNLDEAKVCVASCPLLWHRRRNGYNSYRLAKYWRRNLSRKYFRHKYTEMRKGLHFY